MALSSVCKMVALDLNQTIITSAHEPLYFSPPIHQSIPTKGQPITDSVASVQRSEQQ